MISSKQQMLLNFLLFTVSESAFYLLFSETTYVIISREFYKYENSNVKI